MTVAIDIDELETLASQGLTVKQMADCLGVARSTIYEHKKKNADVSDAIKKGRSKGVQTVANALFESAKSGNVTAMIFYLKNRDPDKWKDRKESKIEKTVHHNYDQAVMEMLNGSGPEPGDNRRTEPTTH